MYVAHIMLFLLFTAQISRTVRKFDNPMYADEFNIHNFLLHPDVLIGQALTLRYKPVNLDVLPLYISLIAASPLILWCMIRRPNLVLSASALAWILDRAAEVPDLFVDTSAKKAAGAAAGSAAAKA